MPIRLADSELVGIFWGGRVSFLEAFHSESLESAEGDKLTRYFWKQSFLYFLMDLVNFLVALFSLRLSSGVLWVCHTLLGLCFSIILFNM